MNTYFHPPFVSTNTKFLWIISALLLVKSIDNIFKFPFNFPDCAHKRCNNSAKKWHVRILSYRSFSNEFIFLNYMNLSTDNRNNYDSVVIEI